MPRETKNELLVPGMVRKKLEALYNPERYHGWTKDKEFYESWYLKVVNEIEDRSFGFIFGIAKDKEGKQQAFIQLLDGQNDDSRYYTFDVKDFVPTKDEFHIEIGENSISSKHISIDLPELKADLVFSNYIEWPKKWYSPGTMGPFSFVPKLECYHQIISMGHELDGLIEVENKTLDFKGGRGYFIKDWGKSFPTAYVWMQSNHFSEKGISFETSVAKIPWMKSSFTGFIAAFRNKDELITFSTYNFSRLKKLAITFDSVEIVIASRKYKLEVKAKREPGVDLASPIAGYMSGRRVESLNSRIEVKITDRVSRKVIFNDVGENGSLDISGEVTKIETNSARL